MLDRRSFLRLGSIGAFGVLPYGDVLRLRVSEHLRQVRKQHDTDLKRGLGRAPLPESESTRLPAASGAGSGYFPPAPTTWSEPRAPGTVNTCTSL